LPEYVDESLAYNVLNIKSEGAGNKEQTGQHTIACYIWESSEDVVKIAGQVVEIDPGQITQQERKKIKFVFHHY